MKGFYGYGNKGYWYYIEVDGVEVENFIGLPKSFLQDVIRNNPFIIWEKA